MKKKLLAILLCVAMLLSVMAGCAKSDTPQTDAPAVDTGNAGDAGTQKTEEPVKLKFLIFGAPGGRNTEFFANEFHEKLLEELNYDISVDFVPWGATDQIATMIASGEKFAFMSHLGNANTSSWPQMGYYATMDEAAIREIAPTYVKLREDYGYGFNAVRFQGNIIALPVGAFPFGGQQDGLAIRNDILNQVGWDYTDIKTYADLMEAFAAVHEKFPNLRIAGNVSALPRTLCPEFAPGQILKGTVNMIVDVDEAKPDDDTVISRFESEGFETFCKMMEDWYDLGYVKMDNLTDKEGAPKTDFYAGNALTFFGEPLFLYDHDAYLTNCPEADLRLLYLEGATPVITKDYDWAWSVSIGGQEDVEHYLRFFEWMYETPENYRFCIYGIEGKDWEWSEAGDVKLLTSDEFFAEWQHRVYDYHAIANDAKPDEVAAYAAFDASSVYSKTIGFTFDSSAVATEAALIEAIVSEKVLPITYGLGDFDAEWPAILQELKDAGLDAYVAEYQRQFSEFMANK